MTAAAEIGSTIMRISKINFHDEIPNVLRDPFTLFENISPLNLSILHHCLLKERVTLVEHLPKINGADNTNDKDVISTHRTDWSALWSALVGI